MLFLHYHRVCHLGPCLTLPWEHCHKCVKAAIRATVTALRVWNRGSRTQTHGIPSRVYFNAIAGPDHGLMQAVPVFKTYTGRRVCKRKACVKGKILELHRNGRAERAAARLKSIRSGNFTREIDRTPSTSDGSIMRIMAPNSTRHTRRMNVP